MRADGSVTPFGGISVDTTGTPNLLHDSARSLALNTGGTGGWELEGDGTIDAFGGAPAIASNVSWPFDIARSLTVLRNGRGGYVLDGYGGIHPFGGAPPLTGEPYTDGKDLARSLLITLSASGVPDGGWVMWVDGSVHAFGAASAIASPLAGTNWRALNETPDGSLYAVSSYGVVTSVSGLATTPNWSGYSDDGAAGDIWDVVLASDSGSTGAQPSSGAALAAQTASSTVLGGVELGAGGTLRTFGGNTTLLTGAPTLPGNAQSLVLDSGNKGGWILDGNGNVWAFGAAPFVTSPVHWNYSIARGLDVLAGGAGGYILDGYGGIHPFGDAPPVPSGAPYWLGHDIARGLDIVLNSSGTPVGGIVLDAWGGLHHFGNAPPVTGGLTYWPGRNIYLQLHDDNGAIYAVATGGLVFSLSGSALAPQWSGYRDWGGSRTERDVALVGSGSGGAQPASLAAQQLYQDTAWTWSIPAPLVAQGYPLDCEAAALQVALNAVHIYVTQYWVLDHIPQQPRGAVVVDGAIRRWGDPYDAFVGNVFGWETSDTGYGVYAPPIAVVAKEAGAHATVLMGASPGEVYSAVGQGDPVVIWTSDTWTPVRMRTWTAWDGRGVPYALTEHAITVVAVNGFAKTVTAVNVADGEPVTFSWTQFQRMWSSFGDMGVVVSS